MLYNKLDLGGFWLKEVIVDQRTVEKERIPKFMDLIINVEKLIINQKMIIEGLRIKHAWERRGKSRTKMKISQLNTLLCGSRTQVIRHAMRVRWMCNRMARWSCFNYFMEINFNIDFDLHTGPINTNIYLTIEDTSLIIQCTNGPSYTNCRDDREDDRIHIYGGREI